MVSLGFSLRKRKEKWLCTHAWSLPLGEFILLTWSVLVSFASLWQNTWDIQLRRREDHFGSWFQRLLFMTVWPITVAWGEAEQQGAWWSTSDHLMAARKGRERKGPESQYPLQEHTPRDLTSCHHAPPLRFHHLPGAPEVGDQTFSRGALGTLQIQSAACLINQSNPSAL
jgi:hypothetical protein